MTILFGRPRARITCRGCGCDDDHACITPAGPCAWILLDVNITENGNVFQQPSGVCSACAARLGWDPAALATVDLYGEEDAA
jgi:hypothetical protein